MRFFLLEVSGSGLFLRDDIDDYFMFSVFQEMNIYVYQARKVMVRDTINLDGGGASASDSDRGNTPGLENGNGNGNGAGTPMNLDQEVDCLTVAEEMRLVDKFCETTLELAKFIGLPSDVTVSSPDPSFSEFTAADI